MKSCHNNQSNNDLSMLLIEIASRNVIYCNPDANVSEVARSMAEKRISSIVVADSNEKPLGIVTERNILHAMQTKRPPETALREIMSSPVITVPPSITCLEAYQVCLRKGVRHLAIANADESILAIVSETDFSQHIKLAALAGRRQVASVMTRFKFSLPPQASLQAALNLMQAHQATCVVVVEAEQPVGIVTERDVVRLYSSNLKQTAVQIGEVMTANVQTITHNSTINEAAERMLAAEIRHLVVVDSAGAVAGVIDEHDLTQIWAMNLADDKQVLDVAFLHTLLNNIPDMIWLKDVNGIYLACNSRFERFFGAKETDIIGKTDYDFVSAELADFFREHDRKSMEINGTNINEEWVTYRDDGHRELLETLKTPLRDSQGKLIGVLGIARDITERKRAEEALRESEEKLRGLYALSPLGIALTDMTGRYLEFNEAFQSICGYSEAELNSLDYWALTPRKYEADEQRQLQSLAATGRYGPYEKEYIRKNGSLIPLRLNGVFVMGSNGQKYIWSIVEDITESKRTAENLALRELEFRTLAENLPDNIARYNSDGRCFYINPQLERTLGLLSVDFFGKPQAKPGDLFYEYYQNILRVGATGKSICFEQKIPSQNQRPRIHSIQMVAETGPDGKPVGVLAVGRDITDIKLAEENLRITAGVFDTSQEGILITDANNFIVDANPAFTHITGYSRDEVLGRNPSLLNSGRQDKSFYAEMWQSLQKNKVWRGEIWNRRKSGELYAELLSISVVCNDEGEVLRHVGVFSDISYLKKHEAELCRVAYYDALTNIPNRVLLADRMKQALAHATREQSMVAVCYLDLDGFKAINDSMGHEAGDQVLINMARRIESTIRGGDTVARLGGDEFVVLLDLKQGEECSLMLERLLAVIAQPMTIKGQVLTVGASIGASIYPSYDENADTLLRHADQAMYTAKQSGKHRFWIYDPELEQRARNHSEFLHSIRHALKHDQFEMYYQPKINLLTKRLVGAEALIRWHHPERGLLSPLEFLHAIEASELDIDIGNWVIASVLAQIHRWHSVGMDIEVSINISAYHLESSGFTENLRQQLRYYPDIPPATLQIEVLESVALNDISKVRLIIEECRLFGVGFSLDDFGTGYSSLSYLSRLPLNEIKIDQSFIQNMLNDNGDKAIVKSIIALAGVFDLKVVAEGIDTSEHYRELIEMGCEFAQGYFIAQPMPAAELSNWQP